MEMRSVDGWLGATDFSCTFITRCTIGMSRSLILKTTTSPTRIGLSWLLRKRMSPRRNAGSIEPLERRQQAWRCGTAGWRVVAEAPRPCHAHTTCPCTHARVMHASTNGTDGRHSKSAARQRAQHDTRQDQPFLSCIAGVECDETDLNTTTTGLSLFVMNIKLCAIKTDERGPRAEGRGLLKRRSSRTSHKRVASEGLCSGADGSPSRSSKRRKQSSQD